MTRENYLADEPWHEIHEDEQIRTRTFRRPCGATLAVSAGRFPKAAAY
jgi:hypothetical protein